MTKLAEIFGRIIGDEFTGIRVADYLSENPHARANDLVKFRGVGMNVATTLMMVMENSTEYLSGTSAMPIKVPEDVVSRVAWLKWEQQENLLVITLDSANHVIDKHIVTKGLVNSTPCHPREALKPAIIDNAVSIIMVHNHPSGSTEPSQDDIALTRTMVAACKIMQIYLLDHLIVTRSGFTSLNRMYPEIFEAANKK